MHKVCNALILAACLIQTNCKKSENKRCKIDYVNESGMVHSIDELTNVGDRVLFFGLEYILSYQDINMVF